MRPDSPWVLVFQSSIVSRTPGSSGITARHISAPRLGQVGLDDEAGDLDYPLSCLGRARTSRGLACKCAIASQDLRRKPPLIHVGPGVTVIAPVPCGARDQPGYVELYGRTGRSVVCGVEHDPVHRGLVHRSRHVHTAGEASDNSPLAIAGVLAVRSFTFAPLEPITGMLADRFPRKTLMVLANIFSFLMLTSFILLGSWTACSPCTCWPCCWCWGARPTTRLRPRTSRVCDEDELLTANALISGGWSASMGIGAGIAGFVISQYGVETGLMIDSVTFLVAAVVISTLPKEGPTRTSRGEEARSRCSRTYSLAGASS